MAYSYASLSAPVDGLNLRDSPYSIKPTEAIQLDNYLVYDWGIRQVGGTTAMTNPESSSNVGQVIFFKNNSGSPRQLICVNNKIYSTSSAGWASTTNLTGALTITNDGWRYAFHQNRIFLVNGTDAGLIYSISAATLAADTFTGLTTDNAKQVFTFKRRLYFVKKASRSIYYPATAGSVSGALTEFDFSDYLEQYGEIVFGTSWSVNQGNVNEQLMVLVTSAGEVLIYSGDYPGASNWQIVTLVNIPPPVGTQGFIKLGQDILIVTSRGVVSLGAIVSGRQTDEKYYNLSYKLADSFGGVDVKPIQDALRPFIYFATSTSGQFFALNFERGAWSKFTVNSVGTATTALAPWDNIAQSSYPTVPVLDSAVSYLMVCDNAHSTLYIDPAMSDSVSHVWRTGFLQIEPNKTKTVDKIRVIGKVTSGTTFTNVAACRFDVLNATTATDTKQTTVATTNYLHQELHTPGVGKRPSLVFTKTSSSEQNELTGVDIFYNVGGTE